MISNIAAIAAALKRARRRACLTQDQLANKIGVDRNTIRNIELCKVQSCKSETFLQLCEILPELMDDLIGAYVTQDSAMQDTVQVRSLHTYNVPKLADSLYNRIMGADTIDECDAIADEVLATTPWLDAFRVGLINPYIPEERLSEHLCYRIRQFWQVAHVYTAITRACSHPNNQEIVAQAFAVGEAYGMGPIPDEVSTIHYCETINQYVGITEDMIDNHPLYDIDTDESMTRSEIIAAFLADGPFTSIDDYASDFIMRFIIPKLDNVVGLNNGHICYKSSNIMPALYQMLLLHPSSDGE